MPTPDYNALKVALADPSLAGFTDAQAADALNQPGPAVQGPVPLSQVLIWAGANNVLPSLNAAAQTASAVQGVAQAALLLLQGSADMLDTGNADVQRMLAGLVQAGVITSAAQASLLALGQTPGASRAVQVFGYPVSDNDVAHARSLS